MEEASVCDDALRTFTPRAQQILGLARKEADQYKHNFVGTEHVLLALSSVVKFCEHGVKPGGETSSEDKDTSSQP